MKEFNLYNITTWGLERDRRYGGFKLPLVFKDFEDERDKILGYCEKYNIKNPFYGSQDTIYLRIENITKRQANNILNQGKMSVHVRFELVEVGKNKNDEKFLNFKVTGLASIDNIHEEKPPEDL